MNVAVDCDLGLTLSHSGGYPGFGSHVLLLPERGVAIFAFANRTYGAPVPPVWDAAIGLLKAGTLPPERREPVSAELATAYRTAAAVYAAGNLGPARDLIAMNFLLDRDADHWARELAALHASVGDCDTSAPIAPGGALTGSFTWRCTHGRVKGSMELAPTRPAKIQQLLLNGTP